MEALFHALNATLMDSKGQQHRSAFPIKCKYKQKKKELCAEFVLCLLNIEETQI